MSAEIGAVAGREAAVTFPRTPSFRLDGKRALVTGAGRGIGLGCAAALAEAGAAVVLCARSESELQRSVAAVREASGDAEAVVLDICDTTRMRQTLEALPSFDILINNAGCNRPKPFVDVTVDDYDDVLDLNLKAAFFVAQVVAKGMISARRGGSIIHMSSQMGHVGAPNRTLYCASKWAMEGMSKAMALDLAAHQIRVNTICPTFIETALTQGFFEDRAFRDSVVSKIKLGRIGQIEDLLGAVLFLASDASALMTGSAVVIDGGWTAE